MANASSLDVTEAPGAVSTEVDPACAWEMRQEYDVIPTIVCSICLSVGLVYCFLGYRCFKMVMFLSGFMLGSAVVCLLSVVQKDSVLDTELSLETKAGMSLGVGVLCGLLTMLLSTLGLILTGLQLGGVLAGAVLLAVAQLHPTLAPWWAPLTGLLATSVLFGLLTLRWQKPLVILSTAVFGATAMALSVDYLVASDASALVVHACNIFSGVAASPLCWLSWAMAGVGPVLCLAGLLVQWRFTAAGMSLAGSAEFKKQQDQAKALTGTSQYRRSHRRANSHGRHRRPPPLKRYTGDVLAPSYIQSLKDRQMGTASSSGSSVSTVTCTVVDFDFETGSMAPLTASAAPLKAPSSRFRL
ncbi:hypothetical protein NHX12_012442 [Muraenolepis orangiensis]|uniref:Transmembrane protein 198 n=1 Tax=Muraenolepis orangiensis TaxID=630683 RepID=A0A9Q0DFG2_9TELE|nr:hypothetical protein NHX12_012442 [Muraenolepis orangiensis]